MIRSADDLRATSRNKNVIRNEMREILKAIEHQMLIINREGRNSVDFKIPKTYASVGSDADSVMLIVAGVLQELLDANYSVKIIDLEHTFLYSIRWDCEMTSEDKQKLIKSNENAF